MHPHLHTDHNKECERVMHALEACHARGFLVRALGACSAAKRDVNLCLRAQRLARTARNRDEADEARRRRRELWRCIDEEEHGERGQMLQREAGTGGGGGHGAGSAASQSQGVGSAAQDQKT